MKSSESSQHDNSHQRKSAVLDDSDIEELTDGQLTAFRSVSPEEHARFVAGVVRPRGRPKKDVADKEQPVPIRLSAAFVAKLKLRAAAAGFDKWQTYVKKILSDELESESVH
jgi:uncharacterized protein (DUF4415 family)